MSEFNILFTGGLGNTMLQYAFGRSLEERGHTVTFNNTSKDLLVNVRPREDSDLTPAPHLNQQDAMRYVCAYGLDLYSTKIKFGQPIGRFEDCGVLYQDCVKNIQGPATLRGIFWSEQYFSEIKNLIHKELTLREIPANVQLAAKFLRRDNSVAVHIRRGDYTIPAVQTCQVYYGEDWFNSAMSRMMQILKNPTFYIFSDDADWCREHLRGEIVSTGNRYWDLYLMTQCSHAIISASTYSWWGAWLGADSRGGKVIAPAKIYQHMESQDVIPSRWETM